MSKEVMAGYKLTEVGVIPDDWKISKFTDVTNLITCGIAATPQYVSESNGYPFLSSTNVKNGNIVWSNYKYISAELHYQLYKNNPPRKGDILYSRVGTIGEAAIVDVDFEFSIYVSLTLIKLNEVLHREFLKQLLNSWSYKKRANDQVYMGGGVGNLNVEVVRNYPIIYPAYTEQRSIASVLSDTDTLIASLDKLIAKKRDIKQAAMQQLLKAKNGWTKNRLGQVATLKARIGWQGLTTKEYKTAGDYYLITGTEFKNGFIDWESCFYVEYERYRQDRNIQIKQNDVLVTKDGTIGKVAFVNNIEKPATLNSGVFVIRPINQSFHPEFFYYLLLSEIFTDFLSQLCAGSTINHLYQKDFIGFEFETPPIEDQQAIAKVLSDMDSDISALEQRRDKTKAIKQAMMQELLTGRIRLLDTHTSAIPKD